MTKLFFGIKNKKIDLLLILTYFLFTVKNLVGYALVAFKEDSVLFDFFWSIANENLEIITFYIAGIALIMLAIYLSRLHVKRPSLMHVIHESGIPKTIKKKIERFAAVYFALVGFFIIAFNLMMEWLAIAVDAPLLMAAIILYIYVAFALHKRFTPESLIHKIGSFGEEFYKNFIELFHKKKRILLGFSGILVLFLLVDVANFIIPYLVNFHDPLYFSQLGNNQQALVTLVSEDLAIAGSFIEKAAIAWLYTFNITAIVLFLIIPSFIWYKVYKRKGFKVSNLTLSILFISISIYILKPVFMIEPIKETSSLVGVFIKTQNIMPSNVIWMASVSLLAGMIVFIASKDRKIKENLMIAAIMLVMLFFTFYIGFYFYSISTYYLSSIAKLFAANSYFLAFYFTIFLTILTIFFISGFIIFALETKKEFRHIK